ncbi:hypothetical protein F4805DRAFT_127717 [Annulohypoxylon moriforme]|nr:hypothetical protein F4805DRAFT_127717 [Annulohypoxylon moriforme]
MGKLTHKPRTREPQSTRIERCCLQHLAHFRAKLCSFLVSHPHPTRYIPTYMPTYRPTSTHTRLSRRSSRRPTEVYSTFSSSLYDSVTQAASAVCKLSATLLVILCCRWRYVDWTGSPSLAELTIPLHCRTPTYLKFYFFSILLSVFSVSSAAALLKNLDLFVRSLSHRQPIRKEDSPFGHDPCSYSSLSNRNNYNLQMGDPLACPAAHSFPSISHIHLYLCSIGSKSDSPSFHFQPFNVLLCCPVAPPNYTEAGPTHALSSAVWLLLRLLHAYYRLP